MLMPILVLKRWDIDGMQIGQRKRYWVVDQNLKTYHLHVDADFGVEEVGH